MGDDGHDYHRLRSFRGTSSSSTESVGSYMSDGSYTNTSGQSLMMKWASRHSPVFAGSSRQSSGTRRGITTNNNTSAMDISIVQGGEDEDDYDSASASASASSGRNELGTINGVIVPCLLNILGVILFLRLGWSVGQAGWLGTLAIFGP